MHLPRLGPIARNSLQTLGVYALRLLIQLALLFVLAHYLGPGGYGEFAAIAALALGLGTLSSFGMGFVVLGETAKSPPSGQAVLAQAVPATCLSAALLLPLYFWLSREVFGSTASLVSLGLIGFSELLFMPLLGLLSFRLQGLGLTARSQAISLLPMLMRLAGVIICIVLLPPQPLDAYAVVYGVTSLLGLLIAFRLGAVWASLPPRTDRPSLATLRQGAGYAVMNFTAMNPSELDKALALRLLGSTETGLYALASRGMAVVTLPIVAMVISAQPRLFREAATASGEAMKLISTLMAAALAYGLLAAAVLGLLAPPMLEWAMGESYAGIGKAVALVAMIAPFMTVRHASGGILLALGRPLQRSAIESAALLLLLVLAPALAGQHGLTGLVWAVFVSEASMAVLGSVILWRYLRRPLALATPAAASAIGAGRERHPS